MNLLFDSFWRAAAYCLHPRVIALSLLPLAIMVAVSGVLGYFYWDPAVAAVAAWLDSSTLWSLLSGWLARLGVGDVRRPGAAAAGAGPDAAGGGFCPVAGGPAAGAGRAAPGG
jgi:hypothetical protein